MGAYYLLWPMLSDYLLLFLLILSNILWGKSYCHSKFHSWLRSQTSPMAEPQCEFRCAWCCPNSLTHYYMPSAYLTSFDNRSRYIVLCEIVWILIIPLKLNTKIYFKAKFIFGLEALLKYLPPWALVIKVWI